VIVRNGRTTSFWTSRWLNGLSPATLFPLLHKHSRRKNRTIIDAMGNDNWIRDLTPNLTMQLISDYVMLWELVNEAGFDPQEEEEDEITWTRTTDGAYSAKSAYEMKFDGNVASILSICIWKAWAPSRCKFFAWLMLQNRIWTSDRLQQRQWPSVYFCTFCRRSLETVNHIFQECPVTRQIWTAVGRWTSSPRLSGAR
jgi:hypothetical protein